MVEHDFCDRLAKLVIKGADFDKACYEGKLSQLYLHHLLLSNPIPLIMLFRNATEQKKGVNSSNTLTVFAHYAI